MGLRLGISRKEKPVDNTTEKYYLVVWWHFRCQPTYFLVPLRKMTKKMRTTFKEAHDKFITRTDYPKPTSDVRNYLFIKPFTRYQESKLNLKGKNVTRVCMTGQLS